MKSKYYRKHIDEYSIEELLDVRCEPYSLRSNDVAKLLGISSDHARKLFMREDFPCVVIGCRRVVRKSEFLAWIDKQKYQEDE